MVMPKKTLKLLMISAVFALMLGAVVVPRLLREVTGDAAPAHGVLPTGMPGRFAKRFETMGTDAAIVVYASDAAEAARFVGPAVSAIESVNALMSFYRRGSDVSALNDSEDGDIVKVSDMTYRVLESPRHFSRITDGAFDHTYKPLGNLWRLAQQKNTLPSEEELRDALGKVGAGGLELLDDNRVRVRRGGGIVDLGGIAKGFAVDAAADALKTAGCRSALVDIGGDMALLGRRVDGGKWRVQVRDPRPGPDNSIMLELADAAVATSGDYARYFTVEGNRYSHIIDPRTGWPVQNVPSVTVVAPDAMTADALATALSVLGAADGMELIDSLPDVECMIMLRRDAENDGVIEVHYSGGFKALLAP